MPAVDLIPTFVEWIDPFGGSAWVELDKAREMTPHKCETIGFLIYEDEEKIVIAATRSWTTSGAMEVGDRLTIPVGVITRLEPVRFGSNKKKT